MARNKSTVLFRVFFYTGILIALSALFITTVGTNIYLTRVLVPDYMPAKYGLMSVAFHDKTLTKEDDGFDLIVTEAIKKIPYGKWGDSAVLSIGPDIISRERNLPTPIDRYDNPVHVTYEGKSPRNFTFRTLDSNLDQYLDSWKLRWSLRFGIIGLVIALIFQELQYFFDKKQK